MTNLDRETQKIRQRLAKPLVARLKYKWSKKEKKRKKKAFPSARGIDEETTISERFPVFARFRAKRRVIATDHLG